jgi:hypothetical protein
LIQRGFFPQQKKWDVAKPIESTNMNQVWFRTFKRTNFGAPTALKDIMLAVASSPQNAGGGVCW